MLVGCMSISLVYTDIYSPSSTCALDAEKGPKYTLLLFQFLLDCTKMSFYPQCPNLLLVSQRRESGELPFSSSKGFKGSENCFPLKRSGHTTTGENGITTQINDIVSVLKSLGLSLFPYHQETKKKSNQPVSFDQAQILEVCLTPNQNSLFP